MNALSKKEETLLLMAVKKNNGNISMNLAQQVYSSAGSAKSAIQTFELHEIVERKAPGFWEVVKLPEDVHKQVKAMQNEKSKEEDYEKEEVDLE